MLLAIDIGNTHTVFGVFKGEEIVYKWRMRTDKPATGDELRMAIIPLFSASAISPTSIKATIIASVVPRLVAGWQDAISSVFSHEPLIVSAEMASGLFTSKYNRVAEIGADRIADAVAMRRLYGSPCAVADFGTATNIEVIDKQGDFIGGILAPGIETASQALYATATKLSEIALVNPDSAIGRSTEEALQIGMVYGEADRLDGLMSRVFEQLGYTMPVIATGGLAHIVAPCSKVVTNIDEDLTLKGLRILNDHVNPNTV